MAEQTGWAGIDGRMPSEWCPGGYPTPSAAYLALADALAAGSAH
jgi:hypothetical protein